MRGLSIVRVGSLGVAWLLLVLFFCAVLVVPFVLFCSAIVPFGFGRWTSGGAVCYIVPFYRVIVRVYLFVCVLLLDLIGQSARE